MAKSNFVNTLDAIQRVLEKRLDTSVFKSVRVEGSHKPGSTSFVFYFFRNDHSGYDMEFAKFNNFRLYRIDGNVEEENRLIDQFLDALQKELLSEYLS